MPNGIKYPRSVQAARSIGLDKKALAEALFVEIPPRLGRPPADAVSIEDQLAETAAEILAATGETYSPATLGKYRQVAAWAANNVAGTGDINWADASWTAHVQAYEKGETFAQFMADPATKRRVRERNGAATGDVPAAARAINSQPDEAAKLVAALDVQAAVAVQRALDQRVIAEGGADTATQMEARRRQRERDEAARPAGWMDALNPLMEMSEAGKRAMRKVRGDLDSGLLNLGNDERVLIERLLGEIKEITDRYAFALIVVDR